MIINSLWAENLLKYAILDLRDIPEKGLIAVVGDNESGKSSIGESICFALFGRTFSLGPDELDKVIRWGESRLTVRLDFTTPGGKRYRIARFLDELGNHGASISRAGEEPMIRGVEEVEAALRDIAGFGYTEFIESFYLAQREITTPHPHSHAVRVMAGVDALEKVAGACREEIGRAEERRAETERQRADIAAQIAALGVDPQRLPRLQAELAERSAARSDERDRIDSLKSTAEHGEEALQALREASAAWLAVTPEASYAERRAQQDGLQRLLGQLAPLYEHDERTAEAFSDLRAIAADAEEALDAFEELRRQAGAHRERLEHLLSDREPGPNDGEDALPFAVRRRALDARESDTQSRRLSTRVAAVLFAVLAVAFWAIYVLLTEAPQSGEARALAEALGTLWPTWRDTLLPWMPHTAGLLSGLFLLFAVRGAVLKRRLKRTRAEREALDEEETAAHEEALSLAELDTLPLGTATGVLARLGEGRIAHQVPSFSEGHGLLLLDAHEHEAAREAFRDAVERLKAWVIRIRTDAAHEIEALHESLATHAGEIARLEEMIVHEKERVARFDELSGIADDLAAKIAAAQRRIQARGLAIELLQGAIHYISQRFNTEVRNLCADSLPKLTNGRYEHLQIDESLKVKAFSSEKRDFMDLDEISSGTQRQIMLAVRLALSQKLVNSVIQGPQTLFLDEPFAFFDEPRTASSLAVLPQVSKDFTQIWVTSQTFPAQSHFDMTIVCRAADSHSPLVRRAETAEHTAAD